MAGRETKEKILQVCARLFAERSYTDVSLLDIAAEVGVKAPAIYRHFASKAQILQELMGVYERHLRSFDPIYYDTRIENAREVLRKAVFMVLPGGDVSLARILRILLKEQFRDEGARRIMTDLVHAKRSDDLFDYLLALSKKGHVEREHVKLYAEILARLGVSYMFTFVQMERSQRTAMRGMQDICEFTVSHVLRRVK